DLGNEDGAHERRLLLGRVRRPFLLVALEEGGGVLEERQVRRLLLLGVVEGDRLFEETRQAHVLRVSGDGWAISPWGRREQLGEALRGGADAEHEGDGGDLPVGALNELLDD